MLPPMGDKVWVLHAFGDAVFDCIYNNCAIRFIQRE